MSCWRNPEWGRDQAQAGGGDSARRTCGAEGPTSHVVACVDGSVPMGLLAANGVRAARTAASPTRKRMKSWQRLQELAACSSRRGTRSR